MHIFIKNKFKNIKAGGGGEMIQWLKAHTDLAEGMSLMHKICIRKLKNYI